ncbi:host specific protein J [Synechococcus phage S-CBS2]|uniref:host specific protein J n=1 Tax=Synechococcus phage S-CBS2 TaxID=753084 RepID=UPI00020783FD|nr:host specific protein J [Synechococcus phage S-CBS2]ADF42392.1 host specific protein J [Synechococcus phage S-CBS2]
MSEENQATEMAAEAPQSTAGAPAADEMMPRSEAENLLKALKAEREARKQYERELKEQKAHLEKFAEINPDEYTKLQQEAAEAARLQAQWGEARDAIEQKYSVQAEAALKEAQSAKESLAAYKKRYALEKVFNAAGGRIDSVDGISFFDLMADQVGNRFRQEADGSLTVIDSQGDPILDKESGKRISPEEYMASFKLHPVYGTFFKGAKGSGAGIGYGGTDANGMVIEDLSGLSAEEMFQRAFS